MICSNADFTSFLLQNVCVKRFENYIEFAIRVLIVVHVLEISFRQNGIRKAHGNMRVCLISFAVNGKDCIRDAVGDEMLLLTFTPEVVAGIGIKYDVLDVDHECIIIRMEDPLLASSF
jgi:hypothetical protein